MINFQRIFPQGTYARFIVKDVLPRVADQLEKWQRRIASIPNTELQRQAWASITTKRFHAEGGSVYACLAPESADTLVALIVALQTISDYLDNLCDRSVSMDETDFRQLHRAMLDAVDVTSPAQQGAVYYEFHPNKDDGGYLEALVDECRRRIAALPSYSVVGPHVRRLAELYNDLQVYKHGPVAGRVPALRGWHVRTWPARLDNARDAAPDTDSKSRSPFAADVKADDALYEADDALYWWEFAAAAGSTLGVFALFAAAARPDLTDDEARQIVESYFPWICGLHILLDYLIDQAEDEAGGDLNLVSHYPDGTKMRQRLVRFVKESRARAARLPEAAFHTTVVQGLPGLYLSDDKVPGQRMQPLARQLLRAAGPASFGYYAWCRLRRIFDPSARPGTQPAPCDRTQAADKPTPMR